MTPTVIFKRSWIYEKNLKPLVPKGFDYPTDKEFSKKIDAIYKLWYKHHKKLLHEMETATGLKWHQKETSCYVISGIPPFSDPLTITYQKDVNVMLDTLTHEMIHRLYSEPENWKKIKNKWQSLMKKYSKEEPNVRGHIPIHALHKHLYLKFFSQKDFQRELDSVKKLKDYNRCWEIVNQVGHENILKKLKI